MGTRSRTVGWKSFGRIAVIGLTLGGACARVESSLDAPDKGARAAEETGTLVSSATARQRITLLRQRITMEDGVATGFERSGATVRPVFAQPRRKSHASTATVELPARANGPVRLEDDASHVTVTFALRGALEAEVEVSDGLALYAGALRGADVVHRPHPEGTEDDVVFETRPEREELTYDIDVSHVAGLRLVNRTLELLDNGGAPRLRVAPPYVVDARGDTHPATLTVEGCQYDTDPRGPWRRAIPQPGNAHCNLRLSWEHVVYPAVVDPTWVTTGSMLGARGRHTATLLGSGQVLVAGGYDGANYLSTAELYDPATGVFASTGPMSNARGLYTATLLSSGKVLVAGGSKGASFLSSAELYDPATGTFTGTGSMTSLRWGHTATQLASGEVLVAGGYNSGNGFLSTAELYDPVTGTFLLTGFMAIARRSHTATRLGSGKVLVTGGTNNGAGLSSAELYDPATGAFLLTGPMADGRSAHSATLLTSGKVLVTGGADNGVFIAGAELYDPASGTFLLTGPMADGRSAHTATLLTSGKVLVAGGMKLAVLSSAEVYDPSTELFTDAGSMGSARVDHTATLLTSGKVLVAGGKNSANLSNVELYLAQGNTCVSADDCASGICNNGVCCAEACDPATCTKCVAVTGACMPVTDADDPDSCTGAESCDSAGACKEKRKLGQPCPGGDANCASGFCADGVCCDKACDGACVACTATLKGSGTDGTCDDIQADTDPRNACPQDAAFPVSCKADGMCDGGGACRQFASAGVACAPSVCANGSASGSFCNGGGTCLSSAIDCTPYACEEAGCTEQCDSKVCKTACGADSDCSGGNECKPDGKCGPKATGFTCKDNHTVVDVDGDTTPCDPYLCVSGICNKSCSSVDDCVAPNICDESSHCVPPSANGNGDDTSACGCRTVGGSMSSAPAWLAVIAVALAVLGRRRSHAACRRAQR